MSFLIIKFLISLQMLCFLYVNFSYSEVDLYVYLI